MAVQIQWRRDTAANWTAVNPTLAEGEAGLETDTGKFKMGDGATVWNSLAYYSAGSGMGLSAGTQSVSTGTVVFSNSNGISFGMSGSSRITASYTVPSTAGLLSNIKVSAGTTSNNLSALTFSDGGNVSFGLNGSVITASAPAGGGGALTVGMSTGGNTAGDTGMVESRLVLAGGNNITLSGNTGVLNRMTISINGPNAQTGVSGIANSQTTYTSGTVTFSELGAITIRSTTGNQLQFSVNSQTVQTQSNVQGISAGTQVGRTGDIVFSDSNGISFGMSGSSRVTASYTVPSTAGLISNINVSAGTTSNNLSAVTFSNANGVSFGLNGSVVTGSVAAAGGAQTGISGLANSETTYTSGSVTFSALGALTIRSTTGQQFQFSVNAQSVVPGIQTIAFANTTFTTGAVSFSNANGISFGSSGAQVTASHNAITTGRASNDAIGLNTAQTNVTWTANSSGLSINAAGYAGTTTAVTGNAVLTLNSLGLRLDGSGLAGTSTGFTGANISASMTHNSAGLAMSLSVAAPGGAASASLYATGNTTQSSSGTMALSSMIVQGTGGVSAGISNGSIVVSGPALTSLSVTGALSASSNGSTISLGVGTVTASIIGNTTQTSTGTVNLNGLVVSGAGGLSAGISAGTLILSGATGGGGGGGMGISAGTQSVSTGTMVFANSNGITFGMSNSNQITASYNSTQFAGTGTTFAGANASGSMTLNSNGLNLSVSVAAPGAAAEQNAINLLGANTAGNTTATGSTIGMSGINLTLSGTNASQIVFSAPATSSLVAGSGISISTAGSTITIAAAPITYEGFKPYGHVPMAIGQPGQHSMVFAPAGENAPYFKFDYICIPVLFSNATDSSNSWSLSLSVGIFSRNGSSLSLITSTSTGASGTASGTAGSYSVWGGPKLLTIPMTSTLGGMDLYLGVWSKTSANAGGQTLNLYLASQNNSNFSGIVGVASSTHQQMSMGLGHYSATFSSGMPSAFPIAQLQGTASLQLRPVALYFGSITV